MGYNGILGFSKKNPRPRNFPPHMGKCQKWVQDPKKKFSKKNFYSSELGARQNVKNACSHKEYIRNDYLDLNADKMLKFANFWPSKKFLVFSSMAKNVFLIRSKRLEFFCTFNLYENFQF